MQVGVRGSVLRGGRSDCMERFDTHRVDGHRAAGQSQDGEQLGNGLDFVGLLRRGTLPNHHARSGGKGRNRMQRGRYTSPERRLVLPSMATTSAPSAWITPRTHLRKEASN